MQEPDPRTLAAARDGDLRAFEDLVRLYQADAFRFARYLTRDRSLAEDVTQEAFIRAFRFLHSYRGDSRFSSWLFRIVRNCGMDALRKRASLRNEEQVPPTPPPNPAAKVELDTALASVSPEHREPFLLIEVLGLSYREAADVLGLKIGTVKSRMHRARLAMCEALATDEAEGDAGEV